MLSLMLRPKSGARSMTDFNERYSVLTLKCSFAFSLLPSSSFFNPLTCSLVVLLSNFIEFQAIPPAPPLPLPLAEPRFEDPPLPPLVAEEESAGSGLPSESKPTPIEVAWNVDNSRKEEVRSLQFANLCFTLSYRSRKTHLSLKFPQSFLQILSRASLSCLRLSMPIQFPIQPFLLLLFSNFLLLSFLLTH